MNIDVVEKPLRKQPFEGQQRWEDNDIKMGTEEVGWESTKWIEQLSGRAL